MAKCLTIRLGCAVAGAAFAIMVLGNPANASNLVVNGSFETGDFTGWTQFGDTTSSGVVNGSIGNGSPTDGADLAYFGPVNLPGGIKQSILTGVGTYNVSFDLSNRQGSVFSVDLGATNLDHFGAVDLGVTSFSYTVTTSGPETLVFTFFNPPSYYTLDNVSVSLNTFSAATPLPSTWLMMLSGFVGLGFLVYRGTKKRTAIAVA